MTMAALLGPSLKFRVCAGWRTSLGRKGGKERGGEGCAQDTERKGSGGELLGELCRTSPTREPMTSVHPVCTQAPIRDRASVPPARPVASFSQPLQPFGHFRSWSR